MSNTKFSAYSNWVGFDLGSSRIDRIGICPMCTVTLEVANFDADPYRRVLLPADLAEVQIKPLRCLRCPECGWWGIEESGADTDGKEYSFGFHYLVAGACRWYDIAAKDLPISVLREYFARNKHLDLNLLDASAFERLVAECLRHEFGPCEVHHVGVSGGGGDGGVDVYMVKDAEEWLIQVKRRLNSKREPIQTIRLLNGVLLREGKHRGMVVTSAEAFSRNAAQETSVGTPGPYSVRLIDRGGVMDMFSRLRAFDFEHFLLETYPEVSLSPLSADMLRLLHGNAALDAHSSSTGNDAISPQRGGRPR